MRSNRCPVCGRFCKGGTALVHVYERHLPLLILGQAAAADRWQPRRCWCGEGFSWTLWQRHIDAAGGPGAHRLACRLGLEGRT